MACVEVPRFTWRAQLQLRPCGRAGWRRRRSWLGRRPRPGWPRRFMPASDSCQAPGSKSSGVILRLPAAAMPACSQHSRQCPFLTAMILRQPAHSPRS